MAWCHRAKGWSHNLNQCWLRSLPSYGITRPKWVKTVVIFVEDHWYFAYNIRSGKMEQGSGKGLEKVWNSMPAKGWEPCGTDRDTRRQICPPGSARYRATVAYEWINHCVWIWPSENRISTQQRFVILKNRGAFSTLVWRHHTCTDVEVLPGTHHCNGARYLTTYMRECKRQCTILPENWHYFCFFYHQKNMLQIRMGLTI